MAKAAFVLNVSTGSIAMLQRVVMVGLVVLGLQGSVVQAQWYASADFLAPRRSINTDAVFQREAVSEMTRTVDFSTTTTETPIGGGGVETVVVETPIRIEEYTETVVGDRVLSTNDIDLGRAAAGRLTVGRRLGDFGLEASFLWAESWEDHATVSDPSGSLVGPFARPGSLLSETLLIENIPADISTETTEYPELAHLNTFAEIGYESKLLTGDINAVGVLIEGGRGTVTGLAGFRFAELKEQFGYRSTSAAPIAGDPVDSPAQDVGVRNRLYGPQLGVMVASPITERVFLTLSAKAAIAYNDIDGQTDWLPFASDPTQDLGIQSRDSATSLLGDFSIGGNFFVTRHLAIRAGFDVLSIGDVALAPDNFRTDIGSIGGSGNRINHRSRATYYSPTIGAMLAF